MVSLMSSLELYFMGAPEFPGSNFMKTCLKIALILCMVSTAIPKTSPIWSVDLKTLGIPNLRPLGKEMKDRATVIDFSADNQILVSFVRYGKLELRTKPSSTTYTELFAFLLDPNTGKVVTQNVWQTESPPTPRIARLPEGGFVLLMGNHLQVLDAKLGFLREMPLALDWSSHEKPKSFLEEPEYLLSNSIKGDLIGIECIHFKLGETDTQIVNTRTLTVVEKWKNQLKESKRANIYEDLILVTYGSSVLTKRIGQEWHFFGSSFPQPVWDAHFVTDNLFIAETGAAGDRNCWFETDGLSIIGKPICYRHPDKAGIYVPSRNSSIIIAAIVKLGGIRATLDLDLQTELIVYRQGTHEVIMKIRPSEFRYIALSMDGSMLAVVRDDILSVYPVPPLKNKR
jgi:hypothetical protein